MLLSKKYFFSLILVFVLSILLSFFPLFGVLGFEYSVFSSLFLAFISVFISAEVTNDTLDKSYTNFNITDFLTKLLLINILLIIVNFTVGLLNSFLRSDCSLEQGLIFYLLIPVVTVIYTTALGALTGSIFRKRGFIVGAAFLILVIVYSIYELYSQPHIFFFNAVLGYFPGSIYDKFIPISTTLVLYRIIILLWAIIIFTFVNIYHSYKKGTVSLSSFIFLVLLVLAIVISYYKDESIGVRYSRDFIQNTVLPGKFETDNFIIHYKPGTKAADEIELIADDHEWRYEEISGYLNVDLENKIHSYIYPDAESRKKYIGTRNATIANPIHQEIHQVYGSFPIDVLKHELVHVLSSEFGSNFLKISPKLGLIEGLAVASDWRSTGLDKHQLSKTLIYNGRDINVEDLLGLGFWYHPPSISYTLMGSYSRFLIDKYGIDNFKEYYRSGSTSVYGNKEDELITQWLEYLKDVELPEGAEEFSEHKFSEKSMFEDSCPRETEFFMSEGLKYYKNNNFYDSTESYEKAFELNPGSPDIKTALAYSYYFNNDHDKLLNLNTEGLSKVDVNIINNLKTNVLWEKSGYDYAYPHYRKLAEQNLPDDIKRDIDIKLDLKRFNRNIKESYKEYLFSDSTVEKVAILEDIKQRYRSYVPLYYLLGRIYFKQGDYGRAIENLEIAEIRRLPGNNLRMENLKLLGTAQYASDDYFGAIKTFRKLAEIDPDDNSYKSYAENFIKRSEWELNK